ncbi:MAG: hypothetical protein KC652_26510 [Cyanobacteria bacterium HKST-UBA01]|nr:hypothetical protein [Cyanobacteria bacterium HKST-UBA01]
MPAEMTLFGGQLTSIKQLRDRLDKLAKKQPKLPDVDKLLTIYKHHTKFDQVLVFEGDTIIDDDLVIDADQSWVKRNKICALVCFGDLTIKGDLINNDEAFWPLLVVEGNLKVCNMLKGGLPLIIWGDLTATGYIIPEYNDGPIRVGGDLNSAGYVPRCKDRKEAKGHVVLGKVSGLVLDARNDLSADDLHRVVVPDAMNYGWFNLYTVFEYGRKGKSIWRETPLEKRVVEPDEELENFLANPTIKSTDPTASGSLEKPDTVLPVIEELIKEKIEFDPDNYSYPENFAEFARAQLKQYPKDKVLVLPGGTTIEDGLTLDWEEDWVERENVIAIFCQGDLTVKGDIINRTLEGGVMLLVAGDLEAENIIKAGATLMVLGNLRARGIVVGEYNDGVTRIGGDLEAEAFLLFDHDGFVRGDIRATYNNDHEDGDWRSLLLPGLFDEDEEDYPNIGRIWAFKKLGREIFI